MKFIPNEVSRVVARGILQTQKASPRLLFVAGLAGIGVGTVLACKATLHIDTVLDEFDAEIKDIKEVKDSNPSYTDHKKDVAAVYFHSSLKIARLYAPSAVIGAASIGCLTGSHITLTRRNAAVTAAYAAISKGFEDYRDRVEREYGKDKETEIYHGLITVPEAKDGSKEDIIKKILEDGSVKSPYSFWFDSANRNWNHEASYNRLFLKCQQDYANDILRARGHIFLSEVLDMCGLERTRDSIVVGWVFNPREDSGDNYVDFGMFDEETGFFISGEAPRVLLNFNVDGLIFDRI